MTDSAPSGRAVETQLQRLLESNTFRKSRKSKGLLQLLVNSNLQGNPLSETEIGIRLFGQPDDWIPDADHSIVRTNVFRLNKRLTRYYETEGVGDLVIIRIAELQPVFQYNRQSPLFPVRPSVVSSEFTTSVENYFADPDTGEIPCVVTGDAAVWHRIDGDLDNNAFGNLIPLCERLHARIELLRERRKPNDEKELQPRYLADELARCHFANWRMAYAYACAHLAFYMGEPPIGDEIPDVRISRLCDALSHARHHFNESIVAHLIRHSLLPLVAQIHSLDPRPFCQLALQLSGICDEAAYFDTATAALTLAESVAGRFAALVYESGSLNRFSLLRRRAQLAMERMPTDASFDYLAKLAEEQAQNNPNLPLTLHVIVTQRWFRQATRNASRKIYEAVATTVDSYKNAEYTGRT
jgi:hypothetical protein